MDLYELSQWAIIDSIIDDVGFPDAMTKLVPAKVSLQLCVLAWILLLSKPRAWKMRKLQQW